MTDVRPAAPILTTARLSLRPLTLADAPFIVTLLNDDAFLEHIGDKGVRTEDDARGYLQTGPLASYAAHGFGLWCVEVKSTGAPAGICGLLKRDALEDVDIGFALMPASRSSGYGFEIASAVMAHAQIVLRLQRIVAIVSPGNGRSIALLGKLGMHFERLIRLSPQSPEVRLFGTTSEVLQVHRATGTN